MKISSEKSPDVLPDLKVVNTPSLSYFAYFCCNPNSFDLLQTGYFYHLCLTSKTVVTVELYFQLLGYPPVIQIKTRYFPTVA